LVWLVVTKQLQPVYFVICVHCPVMLVCVQTMSLIWNVNCVRRHSSIRRQLFDLRLPLQALCRQSTLTPRAGSRCVQVPAVLQ